MDEARTVRIQFRVTQEEARELRAYLWQRKRWKSLSDLARDATWQLVFRNHLSTKQKHMASQGDGE